MEINEIPGEMIVTIDNWDLSLTQAGRVEILNQKDNRSALLVANVSLTQRPFYIRRRGTIPASIENVAVGMIAAFRYRKY